MTSQSVCLLFGRFQCQSRERPVLVYVDSKAQLPRAVRKHHNERALELCGSCLVPSRPFDARSSSSGSDRANHPHIHRYGINGGDYYYLFSVRPRLACCRWCCRTAPPLSTHCYSYQRFSPCPQRCVNILQCDSTRNTKTMETWWWDIVVSLSMGTGTITTQAGWESRQAGWTHSQKGWLTDWLTDILCVESSGWTDWWSMGMDRDWLTDWLKEWRNIVDQPVSVGFEYDEWIIFIIYLHCGLVRG